MPINQSQQEVIKLNLRKGEGHGTIRVVEFKDHQFYVAYMPTLNLSGYGDTENEALDMLFKDVLMDFFEHLMKLSETEVTEELAKYGFMKSGYFKKRFTSVGPHVELSSILSKLNLPPDTKVREKYLQVAA